MDKPEVQQPITAKRDALQERIRNKYPDKQFADDEAYYGQIGDDYDEYDRQIGELSSANEEYKNREATFSNLFSSDPRSARFLMNWKNGDDPQIALIREFGEDFREILDDPERQEEIAAANKEYAERVAKNKELEEEYKKNLQESLSMIDSYKSEGMSDDQIDEVMQTYIKLTTDGLKGIFTKEGFDMCRKALNYDSAVANANEEGIIRGRNEKIDEKLAKPKKGDGHGPLGGESGQQVDRPAKPSHGAIDRFSSGYQNIFERGGEKRTKF